MIHGSRLPILRNFSALVVTQIFGSAIRFLYLIAIARLLEPDDVGLYSYGIAFYMTLFFLAHFGQETLLSKRVGGHRNRFVTTAAYSLSITLIMISIVAVSASIFLNMTEHDSARLQVLHLFILALITRSLAVWARSCFVALEQVAWIPRYEATFRSLEATTGVACLFFGGGLLHICFLHFAFWGVEATASLRLLIQHQGFRLRLGTDWRLLKAFFRASFVFTVNVWLLGVFSLLGIVGLGLFQHDISVVAYFAIAMQFFTTVMIFPISLSKAIIPGLSRAYRYQTESDLQILATALKVVFIMGGVVAVVANAIGPWAITALFGDRYLAAGNTFSWICWAIGPCAAVFIVAHTLNALDASGLAALTALVMATVHAGVMAVLLSMGDWTTGGFLEASVMSAVAGLLAGSISGAVVGSMALSTKLKMPDHNWWRMPLIFSIMPIAVVYFLPEPVGGVVSIFLLIFLTWKTGIFSRIELDRITGRF